MKNFAEAILMNMAVCILLVISIPLSDFVLSSKKAFFSQPGQGTFFGNPSFG
jgi:hypothetical protein